MSEEISKEVTEASPDGEEEEVEAPTEAEAPLDPPCNINYLSNINFWMNYVTDWLH